MRVKQNKLLEDKLPIVVLLFIIFTIFSTIIGDFILHDNDNFLVEFVRPNQYIPYASGLLFIGGVFMKLYKRRSLLIVLLLIGLIYVFSNRVLLFEWHRLKLEERLFGFTISKYPLPEYRDDGYSAEVMCYERTTFFLYIKTASGSAKYFAGIWPATINISPWQLQACAKK